MCKYCNVQSWGYDSRYIERLIKVSECKRMTHANVTIMRCLIGVKSKPGKGIHWTF